jgi:hypothetical protein
MRIDTYRLGYAGRELARQALERNGFTVSDVPYVPNPFAHFYAERAGRKFWFNLRTGNKYQARGGPAEPVLQPYPERAGGRTAPRKRRCKRGNCLFSNIDGYLSKIIL